MVSPSMTREAVAGVLSCALLSPAEPLWREQRERDDSSGHERRSIRRGVLRQAPVDLVAGSSSGSRPCEVNDHLPPADAPLVDVALNEPLLTADDVGALLAVPRSSVYEYARRQHKPLPAMRVGRHVRFYRSDVEAWLEELRGAAA